MNSDRYWDTEQQRWIYPASELPALPEPYDKVIGGRMDSLKMLPVFTAEQMREYAEQAVQAERRASLDAIAALAAQSRDREERDVIARCWNAINR